MLETVRARAGHILERRRGARVSYSEIIDRVIGALDQGRRAADGSLLAPLMFLAILPEMPQHASCQIVPSSPLGGIASGERAVSASPSRSCCQWDVISGGRQKSQAGHLAELDAKRRFVGRGQSTG